MKLKLFNLKIVSMVLLTILIVPFNNCSKVSSQLNLSGSQSSSSLAEPDADFKTGVALYATNCAACHGEISTTGKAGSSVQLISAALNTVPQMSFLSGRLTAHEIELISLALRGPSQIVTDGTKTLFACNTNAVRLSSILKLSNREFSLALSSLLSDFSVNAANDSELQNLMNALPTDISLAQFTRQENSFLLSSRMVSGLFDATYRAAVLVSLASTGLTNYPNTASCLGNSTVTQVCHQNFVRELASRAFRRSLSTTEANQIAATIWNAAMVKSDLIIETFATVVSYPDFIYKAYNNGANDLTLASTVQVTGLELANKLSFFLTGAPATAALRTIASAGGLENASTFKTEVDRMIASSAGQQTLRRLFRESYGYDVNGDLQYNTSFLGSNSLQNLQTSMVQELDYFFTDEVITKKSKFQDLMTSQNSLVTQPSLAQIYGVTANTSVPSVLNADRSGFLTRAALLTKKSGYYTSPIKRGRYVMERVLCDTVGDPPANAPTTVSESQVIGQLASTRTRNESLTQQPNTTCVGCHSKINPYGFALEGFDSLGRKRTVESIFNSSNAQLLGTAQVNTQTAVKLNNLGPSTPVLDATDMAFGLAKSDMAMMCFTKHLKTFDLRQTPSNQDFCHMNETLNSLYGINGNQGTVYDAIITYVTSKTFRSWKY